MSKTSNAFKYLSQDEALRALYIDFEGAKGRPPVYLGVMRRGRRKSVAPHVQSHILHAAFTFAGDRPMSLAAAVESVVQRAEAKNRRIVSWTEYDLDVVRTLESTDPVLVQRFVERYGNARAFAEYWRNKLHGGDKPEIGRLADYLGLIDYAVPAEAAPGDVAKTARAIEDRFENGQGPTPGQEERWNHLIEKNRHDCAGMRRVCLVAARELEAAEA